MNEFSSMFVLYTFFLLSRDVFIKSNKKYIYNSNNCLYELPFMRRENLEQGHDPLSRFILVPFSDIMKLRTL